MSKLLFLASFLLSLHSFASSIANLNGKWGGSFCSYKNSQSAIDCQDLTIDIFEDGSTLTMTTPLGDIIDLTIGEPLVDSPDYMQLLFNGVEVGSITKNYFVLSIPIGNGCERYFEIWNYSGGAVNPATFYYEEEISCGPKDYSGIYCDDMKAVP